MITARCPHDPKVEPGRLCKLCLALGAGIVELGTAEAPGAVVFEMSPAQGLTTGELRAMIAPTNADEALVERKLMGETELDEAGLVPFDEDPRAAEREAYEGELACKLNERLTEAVGDRWGPAAFLVIPETNPSWAGELLRAKPEEIRHVLRELGLEPGHPRPDDRAPMIFRAEDTVVDCEETPGAE